MKLFGHRGPQRWFAWYPVHVGFSECAWLEIVEREYWGLKDGWSYKRIKPRI